MVSVGSQAPRPQAGGASHQAGSGSAHGWLPAAAARLLPLRRHSVRAAINAHTCGAPLGQAARCTRIARGMAEAGDVEAIELLVEQRGANPNAKTEDHGELGEV